LVLAALGMLGFAQLTLETPVWVLLVIPFMFGFGMGNVIAPSTTRMTLATPPQRSGSGSAVQNTVRQVGATLGVAVISSVVAARYSSAMSSALSGSPLPADLRDVASDSVGATYEVAERLQSSGQATLEQADQLRAAADAAYLPAFHVAAYMGVGLILLALVIFLIWLPAQAEAVAWQAGGSSAPPPGADVVEQRAAAEGLDAAHQVHLVAEDPDHLSHVEEAPLELPLDDAGPPGGHHRA
jgi:DHA2 family multidrug resistance protein-like MFS transporter